MPRRNLFATTKARCGDTPTRARVCGPCTTVQQSRAFHVVQLPSSPTALCLRRTQQKSPRQSLFAWAFSPRTLSLEGFATGRKNGTMWTRSVVDGRHGRSMFPGRRGETNGQVI